MRMVRLPPPGTLCRNHAVIEIVSALGASTFCEIGIGDGEVASELCRRGMTGTGIEFSPAAAAIARSVLKSEIEASRFHLIEDDFMAMAEPPTGFDLALSLMVMEHVEDDAGFLARMAKVVKPGGTVIVGVPGRMDRWGIEDETAGHFRRYGRGGLETLFKDGGLDSVEVRSVSVPLANLTFHASNFLIRRAGEERKLETSQDGRTKTSGIRDIPFKTQFPSAFKLVLNPVAMYPWFMLQRAFYRTNLGLILLAKGRRP